MSARITRETYDAKGGILPELPLIGLARRGRADGALAEHEHAEAFEIFLFERGSVSWYTEREIHTVEAKHIYLNRPGERHGSAQAYFPPCGYSWIQLSIPPEGLPGLDLATSERIRETLMQSPTRYFAASDELQQCFGRLFAQHRQRDENSVLCARGILHQLLAHLLRDCQSAAAATAASANADRYTYAIRRALSVLDGDVGEVSSVGAVAAHVQLSLTQFNKRFLAEVGFTPGAYLRRKRIDAAKQMIAAGGQNLAEIAARVGFSSSQHLATAFRQLEGTTPSHYARSLQLGGETAPIPSARLDLTPLARALCGA